MIDLKLESQGIWIANLADEYAFKIEPVGSPEIPMSQRSKLASRIARCVSAMAGIGDDNALFAPGNSVRSVLVSNELKRLELEKQRDELQDDRDNWRNEARSLRKSQERLWKQRDELLAALEELTELHYPADQYTGETLEYELSMGSPSYTTAIKARAAIAKAKGPVVTPENLKHLTEKFKFEPVVGGHKFVVGTAASPSVVCQDQVRGKIIAELQKDGRLFRVNAGGAGGSHWPDIMLPDGSGFDAAKGGAK